MNASASPAGTSHLHRSGGAGVGFGVGVGVGVGGADFLGRVGGADFLAGPGRAEVARCQVLTNGIPLLAYSGWISAGHTAAGNRQGCRDAHAAPVQIPRGRRPAVAGCDGIMLVSGVPARARGIRRRLAVRCCRHKVALPTERIQRSGRRVGRPEAPPQAHVCAASRNKRRSFTPSQPRTGRRRNNQSRMSPSP
jgi:hypothetical protein